MFDTLDAADRATRRRSLLTLGGAVLATVMASSRPARAGEKGTKAKKRVKTTCQRQIGACRAFFTELCAADPGCEVEQVAEVFPCCELLRNCKAGQSVECFFGLVAG
jgi:hypothetical protein